MKCFTPERIAEFDKGIQPTEEENIHIFECDNCMELHLLHGC
jgi:hypothetical protein